MPAQSPEATRALLAAAFNAGDLDAFVAVNEDDAALVVPARRIVLDIPVRSD